MHSILPADHLLWPGFLGDLHAYNLSSMRWSNLSSAVSGSSPSPRNGHRMTPMVGKLFVQGGADITGELFVHSQIRILLLSINSK